MNNVQIGRRLRQFGEQKYATVGAFAKALGMRPQTLNNYLSGTVRPGNVMHERLRALGCDIDWLMTGKPGPPAPEDFEAADYPIVSKIRAGKDGTVAEPQVEYSRKASGPAGPRYKGSMFFEVEGDSMEPRWEHGDLVLVNPKIKPKSGDYGIVCWEREAGCLKKIYYEKGAVVLQSINPAYKAIVVNPKEIWFIGKVLITKHKE